MKKHEKIIKALEDAVDAVTRLKDLNMNRPGQDYWMARSAEAEYLLIIAKVAIDD